MPDRQRETAPELLDRSLPSWAFKAVEEMHKGRTTMSALHRYETAFSRKFDKTLKDLTAKKEKRNGASNT